jgi:hypothetical protein
MALRALARAKRSTHVGVVLLTSRLSIEMVLRMIVKYLTAQQRLGFGDKKKKEAKTGFYWQAEVDDAWIGPFETLEEASTDGKQSCFGVV